MQHFLFHALKHTLRKGLSAPCAHCAFFKIVLRSASFLLIAIHVCIPDLVWPNTGRPKMWAVALVEQQPLKILSQNLQAAIFAPPW